MPSGGYEGSPVRNALRLVAIIDWLSVAWAMVEWRRLSNANVQTSPEAGVVALFGIWLVVIGFLGVTSGIGLASLASSSNPEKLGAVAILVGLPAPILLLVFLAR